MLETTSTRPYLIRAMHAWCCDNGFTPYISVRVDEKTQVPLEHVKDNEIILNVSLDASSGLQLGNEFIQFKSRFSGVVREIFIPINNIQAIFARENGQGMSFPMVIDSSDQDNQSANKNKPEETSSQKRGDQAPARARPNLKIVK